MTGRRLVSLPFSDHCEPLFKTPPALTSLLASIGSLGEQEGKYIELRPLQPLQKHDGYFAAARYCWHSIDLRSDLESIFARLHRNHVQRSLRKAERLGVTVETGRSTDVLQEFYRLHLLTRSRHGVPVQPFSWFQSLSDCFGGSLTVYIARLDAKAVSAILTITHRKRVVYKYGGSNPACKQYGATPLLFWKAIQDAKAFGCEELDLGRSDLDNPGLIAFKDHLAARRAELTYYRTAPHRSILPSWGRHMLRRTFTVTPRAVQARIGSALYRHLG
jgi:lipid II:glycine glycyltransferase (peptidoglycan interpeptide bridge formation enzyme)